MKIGILEKTDQNKTNQNNQIIIQLRNKSFII